MAPSCRAKRQLVPNNIDLKYFADNRFLQMF